MSQRNIELHNLGAAAVNARQVPEDLLAPDFRLENRVTAVTDHTHCGTAGWREWMSDLFDVFSHGARSRSGMPLVFRWAGVTWFEDGKATRAVGYATRREALQAVGLAE
jgi:hypothetical protein